MSRRVPRKEVELLGFVDGIIAGFKTNPDIFKEPPFTDEQLTSLVNIANLTIDNVAQNKATYEAAIMAKDAQLKDLYKTAMETAEYCYRITKDNKALLAMVGLEPPAEKKPQEPPGQCPDFEVIKQEIGKVSFRWKRPVKSGRIRAYVIQRKAAGDLESAWETIWSEVEKEAEIKDQPQDKAFDYRVRALNTAGIGAPSNTVTVKF